MRMRMTSSTRKTTTMRREDRHPLLAQGQAARCSVKQIRRAPALGRRRALLRVKCGNGPLPAQDFRGEDADAGAGGGRGAAVDDE